MATGGLGSELSTVLGKSRFFGGWGSGAIAHLLEENKTRHLEPGEPVVTRGELGNEFFVVLDGVVDIRAPRPAAWASEASASRSGEAVLVTVDRRHPGEVFGEIACLLTPGRRTATVVASTSCRLAVVSQERFLDTLQRFPEASLPFARQLATRVQWYTDHLAGLVRPQDQRQQNLERRNWWQRGADSFTKFFAGYICFFLHLGLWGVWLFSPAIPFVEKAKWEADHVAWLTNFVSLEAIILSIALLVAARRKEEKDQARDDSQFTNTQVNVNQSSAILAKLAELDAKISATSVAQAGGQSATSPVSGGGGASGFQPASPAAP